jgi:hypothetical protein
MPPIIKQPTPTIRNPVANPISAGILPIPPIRRNTTPKSNVIMNSSKVKNKE